MKVAVDALDLFTDALATADIGRLAGSLADDVVFTYVNPGGTVHGRSVARVLAWLEPILEGAAHIEVVALRRPNAATGHVEWRVVHGDEPRTVFRHHVTVAQRGEEITELRGTCDRVALADELGILPVG